MSEQNKKTYLKGSVKEVTFNNGGRLINASFNIEDLKQYADEKGWVKTVLKDRREPDDYGNNMYAMLNDYKPKSGATAAARPSEKVKEAPANLDDLPF